MQPTDTRNDSAGARLKSLRQRQRVSQLDLSLRVGVSQRHLSFVETGRARASREMLHALLEALDAPLAERNDTLLAAGYAPAYAQRPLRHADMAPVRDALERLLAAHDPSPAFVLDDAWNLLQANRGAAVLVRLIGGDPASMATGFNLLRATLSPAGLRNALINAEEVIAEVWQRAQREAVQSPALRSIVEELRPVAPRVGTHDGINPHARGTAPLLLTRFRSTAGELAFLSTFTTFGAPLDVTAASLRVEHFFPADEATRAAMAAG